MMELSQVVILMSDRCNYHQCIRCSYKISAILTPTATSIFGSDNMTQVSAALSNAAQVLATGVERVNSVGSGTLTTDTLYSCAY